MNSKICAAALLITLASASAQATPLLHCSADAESLARTGHRVPRWPSYLALAYRKPGHPKLTKTEVGKIRKILARVRPCQRRFVRYAFSETDNTGRRGELVLFFGPGCPNIWPHALGESNAFFDPSDGRFFPVSDAGFRPDYSLRADMDRLGCPSGDVIPEP